MPNEYKPDVDIDAAHGKCYEVAGDAGLSVEEAESCEDGEHGCLLCPYYIVEYTRESALEMKKAHRGRHIQVLALLSGINLLRAQMRRPRWMLSARQLEETRKTFMALRDMEALLRHTYSQREVAQVLREGGLTEERFWAWKPDLLN